MDEKTIANALATALPSDAAMSRVALYERLSAAVRDAAALPNPAEGLREARAELAALNKTVEAEKGRVRTALRFEPRFVAAYEAAWHDRTGLIKASSIDAAIEEAAGEIVGQFLIAEVEEAASLKEEIARLQKEVDVSSEAVRKANEVLRANGFLTEAERISRENHEKWVSSKKPAPKPVAPVAKPVAPTAKPVTTQAVKPEVVTPAAKSEVAPIAKPVAPVVKRQYVPAPSGTTMGSFLKDEQIKQLEKVAWEKKTVGKKGYAKKNTRKGDNRLTDDGQE